MSAVIATRGLTRTFGQVRALDGLDLEIPAGGVFGILGPNGAGKSTLFRILLGLIHPTSGQASVLGDARRSASTLRRTGSMIESPRFPHGMKARDVLIWLSLMHGRPASRTQIDAWLERVGLATAADRPARGFSVGMMQRLGVAAALISDPEVVILDEPTSGMDPIGIVEMRKLIRTMADEDGRTVILASHQLAEVERICDRVAMLSQGRLISSGRVADIVHGESTLRIEAEPIAQVLDVLGARGSREGDAAIARITREEAPELLRQLVGQGIDITEARWVGSNLESFYMAGAAHGDNPEPQATTDSQAGGLDAD